MLFLSTVETEIRSGHTFLKMPTSVDILKSMISTNFMLI